MPSRPWAGRRAKPPRRRPDLHLDALDVAGRHALAGRTPAARAAGSPRRGRATEPRWRASESFENRASVGGEEEHALLHGVEDRLGTSRASAASRSCSASSLGARSSCRCVRRAPAASRRASRGTAISAPAATASASRTCPVCRGESTARHRAFILRSPTLPRTFPTVGTARHGRGRPGPPCSSQRSPRRKRCRHLPCLALPAGSSNPRHEGGDGCAMSGSRSGSGSRWSASRCVASACSSEERHHRQRARAAAR